MNATELMILALLARAPGHGYDLKKRIERLTGATFALNDKLLYPALRRFESDGLVTSELTAERTAPPRRVFSVTDDGREAMYDALSEFTEADARNDHEFLVRFLLFGDLSRDARLSILARRRAALERSLERIGSGSIPDALSGLAEQQGMRLIELARRQATTEIEWLDQQQRRESQLRS